MSAALNIVDEMSSKRRKRSEAEVLADLKGSPLKEAVYVLERISKLEEKMNELLMSVSPEARDYVFTSRPELKK